MAPCVPRFANSLSRRCALPDIAQYYHKFRGSKAKASVYRRWRKIWDDREDEDGSATDGSDGSDDDTDSNDSDGCALCDLGGEGGLLLCCDGCDKSTHMSCCSIDAVPDSDWFCRKCSEQEPEEQLLEKPEEQLLKKPDEPEQTCDDFGCRTNRDWCTGEKGAEVEDAEEAAMSWRTADANAVDEDEGAMHDNEQLMDAVLSPDANVAAIAAARVAEAEAAAEAEESVCGRAAASSSSSLLLGSGLPLVPRSMTRTTSSQGPVSRDGSALPERFRSNSNSSSSSIIQCESSGLPVEGRTRAAMRSGLPRRGSGCCCRLRGTWNPTDTDSKRAGLAGALEGDTRGGRASRLST